jgi:DNA invertase Pin-like site-specific DNA recombinase
MAIIGYARVSTKEQNLDLQVEALKSYGAVRIYADKGVTGTKSDRPELNKALERLEPGDTLAVWKLDRLSRSTLGALEFLNDLAARDVPFVSVTQPELSTTGAMGHAIRGIFIVFAEMEHSLMIERTQAGLAAARAKGNFGGRPRKMNAKAVTEAATLKAAGYPVARIAKLMDVSAPTVYRYLQQGAGS